MQPHFTALGKLPLSESPYVSLPALLDLLDALEVALQGAPGLIPLFAAELRRGLVANLEAPT